MKIRYDTFVILFTCITLIGMEILFLAFYYIPPFISVYKGIPDIEPAMRVYSLVNAGTTLFVIGMLGLLVCKMFEPRDGWLCGGASP